MYIPSRGTYVPAYGTEKLSGRGNSFILETVSETRDSTPEKPKWLILQNVFYRI
jgi:hypothetical protein